MSSRIFAIAVLFFAATASAESAPTGLSNNSIGGCFGGRPQFAMATISGFTPAPALSTRAFEKVFSVLKDFTPEPVEFIVETTSLTFDALAVYDSGRRRVHMMLGLLLARGMDEDALALVACHELGHHFGGRPTHDSPPLSYEGQADFYATGSCFSHWMKHSAPPAAVDESAREYCANVLRSSDGNCARSMAAALKLTKIVAQRFRSATTELPLFDPNIVAETLKGHAAPQCRLDTMKAGFACHVAGTCETAEVRPACWYARPVASLAGRN